MNESGAHGSSSSRLSVGAGQEKVDSQIRCEHTNIVNCVSRYFSLIIASMIWDSSCAFERLCPRWSCVSSLLLALLFCGCGGSGGGGSQPPPPPPTPDFELTVSPSSISIAPGGSATASLSATPLDGFSSPVSIQVTGLPGGVTVFPATINL